MRDFHRRTALLLSLVAPATALGCAATEMPDRLHAPEDVLFASEPPAFTIGPNDILRAQVHGHPELSTPFNTSFNGTRVDPSGDLSLPLVGPIHVGGLQLDEARERITAAYAVYLKEPRIDVSVVEYAARRFYLYGQVERPGAFVIDRPLNVYQALSLGGGFGQNADREEIVLLRESEDGVLVEVVNGDEPDPSGLLPIHPDDFLFVRRTGAGSFREEVLPILSGISSSLSSVATLILIEDRLDD